MTTRKDGSCLIATDRPFLLRGYNSGDVSGRSPDDERPATERDSLSTFQVHGRGRYGTGPRHRTAWRAGAARDAVSREARYGNRCLYAASVLGGQNSSYLLSPACWLRDQCTPGEDSLAVVLGLTSLAGFGLIAILGWRGKLFGARARERSGALPLESEPLREFDAVTPADAALAKSPASRTKAETKMAHFFDRHRTTGYLAMTLTHLVLRGWGAGFLAMFFLISTFEDQLGRTHWFTVLIISGIVLFGFLVSNAILRAGRSVGLRDPLRYVSYAAGVVLSWLVFLSPMRP